jgi:uncharacterized membrane protein (UPF0127 family)
MMRRFALPMALVTLASFGCGGTSDTVGTVGVDSIGRATSTNAPDGSALAARLDAVSVSVIDAVGVVCELCLWRADTDEERRRGLMGVTDLEGADGMLFSFEEPSSGGFWMKDTLIALDVSFYGTDGSFLGADSMEPCAPGSECPVYAGAPGYSWAIEVPAGDAESFGMEPGGRITIGEPCDPSA